MLTAKKIARHIGPHGGRGVCAHLHRHEGADQPVAAAVDPASPPAALQQCREPSSGPPHPGHYRGFLPNLSPELILGESFSFFPHIGQNFKPMINKNSSVAWIQAGSWGARAVVTASELLGTAINGDVGGRGCWHAAANSAASSLGTTLAVHLQNFTPF